MNKESAKKLLGSIKELAKTNVVIDTFLREVIVNIKTEFIPSLPSDEYIENAILEKHLFELVEKIIRFQSPFVTSVQEEIEARKDK
jgi:hypothetical protein